MSDRRDFLKLFGAGAAIIPIIGGVPILAAESKLLDSPRVELATSSSFISGDVVMPGLSRGLYRIFVMVENHLGRRQGLVGKTFITSYRQDTRDIYSESIPGLPAGMVRGNRRITWDMSGQFTADESNNLVRLIQEGE